MWSNPVTFLLSWNTKCFKQTIYCVYHTTADKSSNLECSFRLNISVLFYCNTCVLSLPVLNKLLCDIIMPPCGCMALRLYDTLTCMVICMTRRLYFFVFVHASDYNSELPRIKRLFVVVWLSPKGQQVFVAIFLCNSFLYGTRFVELR